MQKSVFTILYFLNRIFCTRILFLLCCFAAEKSLAQCTAVGPNNGSYFTTDNSVGTINISNASNASNSNNSYATASATLVLLTGSTNYLVAKDFGFLIPSTATICGIKAEVEKSATGINILAYVEDNSVRLIKGGAIVGSNYASGANWPSSDVTGTYGNASDLWGTTWTPEEITDANFGIAFSAKISGIVSLLPTARIDHIKITVSYSNPLPLKWLYFKGSTCENTTHLEWATASESGTDKFIIEESINGLSWYTIDSVNAAGFSTAIHKYDNYITNNGVITDCFYRLKERDFNGEVSFSPVIKICNYQLKELFEVKQSTNLLHITFYSKGEEGVLLKLMSLNGTLVYTKKLNPINGFNYADIPLNTNVKGLYFFSLIDTKNKLCKKINIE